MGASASLSVQASQFPGVEPNSIYYTDDSSEAYGDYEGVCLDMGVFNIANCNLERCYKRISLNRFTPPIWVTPTPGVI